jgi:hypothetical protein
MLFRYNQGQIEFNELTISFNEAQILI